MGANGSTFLEKHSVKEVLKEEHQKLMTLQADSSVGAALVTLNWAQGGEAFSAAPVYTDDDGKGDFVGVWGVRDAVKALYDSKSNQEWLSATISPQRSDWVPTQPGSKLSDIVSDMIKSKSHRAFVMDKERVVDVVPQSQIVRFLAKHAADLNLTWAHGTVQQLGLGFIRHMIFVRPQDSVHDAFSLMGKHDISSVVVRNAEGVMDNSLAVENIRLITAVEQLDWTVEKFLHHFQLHQRLHVTPETPFEEVLLSMNQERVHRLFVCNPEGAAVSVVTLSDLLNIVFNDT